MTPKERFRTAQKKVSSIFAETMQLEIKGQQLYYKFEEINSTTNKEFQSYLQSVFGSENPDAI